MKSCFGEEQFGNTVVGEVQGVGGICRIGLFVPGSV